ncbi:MAG: adenylate/guanylate cyclase domain-containing protein, partial [Gemmatimonadota bacterium]|nr:adenylate/guanylate cyclase domain-containing protein [Gemmatimonadota bacterium]
MAERAILFADVCNSTGITEALGDVASRKFIGELLEELTEITEANDGRVVKTIGDEIMSSFERAMDGIAAAVDMQRAMNARPPVAGMKTGIRVGIHFGPVVIEGDDLFGDVVNVSARVVALSAADQVLTTQDAIEAADGPVPHRSLGVHSVKGREEQLHLCEILWRGETAQMTVVAPKLDLGPKA